MTLGNDQLINLLRNAAVITAIPRLRGLLKNLPQGGCRCAKKSAAAHNRREAINRVKETLQTLSPDERAALLRAMQTDEIFFYVSAGNGSVERRSI